MINTENHFCDIALIGFPNAGKSTLFNALTGRTDSNRMPRYAPVRGTSLAMADIGGISRGTTSVGENPGARWLTFVETARLLAFVIPSTEPRPAQAFRYLLKTVLTWNPGFAEKERLVIFNRFTGGDFRSGFAGEHAGQYPNEKTAVLNAATGEGLGALVSLLAKDGNHVVA